MPGSVLVATGAAGVDGAPMSGPEANRLSDCWAIPLILVNSPATESESTDPTLATVIARGPMPPPMPSFAVGYQGSHFLSWSARR